MKSQIVIVLLCVPLWFNCKEQSTDSGATSPKFAFYRLTDSTITASEAWNLSLDSLALSQSPFLTENDLTKYYWYTNSFCARPNIDTLFSKMRWLAGKSAGVPFVVVAGGSRIYVCAFWWMYSSQMPTGAYIDMSSHSPYAIQREQLASIPDMRNDRRIHDALKSANILVE
jgi:hypothetical protein